ncbi:MAG: M36 family metallopeptidase [Ferruginibacter sp.]
MKNFLLFCALLLTSLVSHAQDLDKAAAKSLVAKNQLGIGLKSADLQNLEVSNAYHDNLSGSDLVYMQQQYKGVPVLNQLLVLAFKNGRLVSNAGHMYRGFEKSSTTFNERPSVSAEAAVMRAVAEKKLTILSPLTRAVAAGNKKGFGKAGISKENITAELFWEVDSKNIPHLVWQVYFAPLTSSDNWLIRVDANNSSIVSEHNLTVYCNWNNPNQDHSTHNHDKTVVNTPSLNNNQLPVPAQKNTSGPEIVNSATYRVIPFPAESPNHPGGAHALRTDPWTAAAGNATTLKWHSDGTNDYNYTRGNNVWAYQDRTNLNVATVDKSTTSLTSSDPLNFDFTPDFNQSTILNSPARNKDFNVTNLFYWNNIIHDVMYQYGFDEVSGNFQTNNQGRGGVGTDPVMAEAQDASGSDNANFATNADGQSPRMQMYIWNKPNKPAFTLVNAPASIAGNKTSVESNFLLASGLPANNILAKVGPVTADVVYYNDNTGTTHDACVTPSNTMSGKIVLINRGNCDFVVKVQNAQNAGAVGVIMIQNTTDAPIIMGGSNVVATLVIPAVMVSQADGAILIAQVGNGLNVTLAPDMTDGDVDNGVVVHEFGHGISNRLAGGPSQAGCVSNAEQMGEGWSDYFALMVTQDWASSNVNTGFTSPRGMGTYAISEPITGLGIRTKKYCTDFTVNDWVFSASLPGTGLQHTRGELWATTLWDMTWNIIQQTNSITPNIYNGTGTGGNVIALKLVMEGLKLQPCNSGFIDARDAILRADQLLYNGAYSCAIREAFRRRGMGLYASQGSANSVTDQVPDYTSYVDVKLTQNVTQVPEGQNIVYTNIVNACGAVTNYILRDTLPSNVTYVSGGTYDATTRVVSFPVNFTAGGSQTYSFTVSVNAGSYYAPTTYLNETVTAAAVPATLTATSTTTTNWVGTNAQSHSAPNSLFSANSAVPSDQILRTTAAIALGSNQSALSFWHRYDTEQGYDGGVVEISTDNGTTWTDLDPKMILGYYNAVIDAASGTAIAGRKAYTGSNGTSFIKTDINISSYAGQSALFRWRFVSDNGTSATGWYVDDILVKNEAVVNMRSSLFNASGTRAFYADTVTMITNTCTGVSVTTQPANQTACAGANASFTVVAAGTSPTYQWQVSTNSGGTWTNITGATTATLSLTAVTAGMTGNQYRVIISNTCPSTVTSNAATLTVTAASAISTQPTSVTVCAPAAASFSVVATGTSLTYQWQVSTNGGTSWTDIAGATTATYNIATTTAALNGNQYRVSISTCATGGLFSNAVTLTVNSSVAITTQPANQTACAGSNATFSVTATSAGSYQWQVSTNSGGTWTNITGATASTLTLTAVTAGMNGNQYRVIVSNTCPSTVNSNAATLTVTTPSSITTQPSAVTVCAPAAASFTVVASGTSLTYQWQVSTNGGTSWTDITGATAATYTIATTSTALNGNQYRVNISTCATGGLTSSAVTLTVNAAPAITTQPQSSTVCTGANASFSVVATGTNITYQWQVSTDGGGTWTNVTGATTATLSVASTTAAMNGNRYRVVVSGTCTPASVTSAEATLTVNNSINITQQPQNVALCSGLNASFSVTAAGSGLTYQWQVSTDGGTSWSNITGATTATLTVSSVQPSMNNNRYRVVLNGSCASNVNSNAAILTVNSSVTITTQPSNQTGCAPAAASFTVVATGTSITYQWQVSTNGGTSWTNITGATATSYTITTLDASLNGNQYRVIVTGTPCGSVTSSAASLTIGQLPTVTIAANPTTIIPGQTSVLTATASPAGTYTYQWFKNGDVMPGQTGASVSVTFGDADVYTVTAFNSNGCSNTSAGFSLGFGQSNIFFIYPSPNNGQFHVRYYSAGQPVTRVLNIYDSKGARIYSKAYSISAPYTDMQVDISRFSGGVYLVELLSNNGERLATGKVAVQ